MDFFILFLIYLFILLIIYLFIFNNKKKNSILKSDIILNSNNQFNNYSNDFNKYYKYGNEENLKDNIEGYENELMYSNNLKDGDYINQFKETVINDVIKDDNQIGFNPEPREQMKTLPFANIHSRFL